MKLKYTALDTENNKEQFIEKYVSKILLKKFLLFQNIRNIFMVIFKGF